MVAKIDIQLRMEFRKKVTVALIQYQQHSLHILFGWKFNLVKPFLCIISCYHIDTMLFSVLQRRKSRLRETKEFSRCYTAVIVRKRTRT